MIKRKSEIPPLRRACLLALGKLMKALTPFMDDFVVIGGWAPYLLLNRFGAEDAAHVGSADVDLYFDSRRMTPERVHEVMQALRAIGSEPMYWMGVGPYIPFSFWIPVRQQGAVVKVRVDLLGLEEVPAKSLPSHFALALRASEDVEVQVRGASYSVRVSGAAAVLAMKAAVLTERRADKDAYDLYTLARYYKNGPESLAEELKPLRDGLPIKTALKTLRKWFVVPDAPGPQAVARFVAPNGSQSARRVIAEQTRLTFETLLESAEAQGGPETG